MALASIHLMLRSKFEFSITLAVEIPNKIIVFWWQCNRVFFFKRWITRVIFHYLFFFAWYYVEWSLPDSTYIRVGKIGYLGPWSRVIVYCRSVRMLPVIIHPNIHVCTYISLNFRGRVLVLLAYDSNISIRY